MVALFVISAGLLVLGTGYLIGRMDALERRPYHVKYVENCSAQKRKTFKTRAEAAKWVANFKLKHQGTRIEPDCWIDMVFQGDVVFDEGDPK